MLGSAHSKEHKSRTSERVSVFVLGKKQRELNGRLAAILYKQGISEKVPKIYEKARGRWSPRSELNTAR
jgi:hypothetical protein